MARGDGLKNYENLDLKDAKNGNRLTKVYRDWAKKYDYDNDHVLGTVSQPKSVNLLSTRLKDKTAKIIDVGCGTALVGEKLKAKDFIYFDGIDISEDMLSIAKYRGYRNLFLGSLNKQLPLMENAYDFDNPRSRYGGPHFVTSPTAAPRLVIRLLWPPQQISYSAQCALTSWVYFSCWQVLLRKMNEITEINV